MMRMRTRRRAPPCGACCYRRTVSGHRWWRMHSELVHRQRSRWTTGARARARGGRPSRCACLQPPSFPCGSSASSVGFAICPRRRNAYAACASAAAPRARTAPSLTQPMESPRGRWLDLASGRGKRGHLLRVFHVLRSVPRTCQKEIWTDWMDAHAQCPPPTDSLGCAARFSKRHNEYTAPIQKGRESGTDGRTSARGEYERAALPDREQRAESREQNATPVASSTPLHVRAPFLLVHLWSKVRRAHVCVVRHTARPRLAKGKQSNQTNATLFPLESTWLGLAPNKGPKYVLEVQLLRTLETDWFCRI